MRIVMNIKQVLDSEHSHIGKIHAMETFGLVDGPGVRCVIFLQGCRMRCQYCHNPETWSMEPNNPGSFGGERTAQEVFEKAYRYRRYWKDNGGITVSGGEPLLQIDFLIELFARAKEKGIHTTLDTSGNPFTRETEFFEKFQKLMEVTDLVMLDMKEMDSEKHKTLTGHGNTNILDMADYLSEIGKDMWIRHVLVPDLTDDENDLRRLREKIDKWKNVTRVEILPYHTLGEFKWENLKIPYPLKGVRTPTEEEVAHAEQILGIEKDKK